MSAVFLNVYDLFPANSVLRFAGLGAYHTGLEVYGKEWSYGMLLPCGKSSIDLKVFPDLSGIYATRPRHARDGNGNVLPLRSAVFLGHTSLPERSVSFVLEAMQRDFLAKDYSAVHKNCTTFCDELSVQLTGRHVPTWTNRLALLGGCLPCLFPKTSENDLAKPVAEEMIIPPEEASDFGLESDSIYEENNVTKMEDQNQCNEQRDSIQTSSSDAGSSHSIT